MENKTCSYNIIDSRLWVNGLLFLIWNTLGIVKLPFSQPQVIEQPRLHQSVALDWMNWSVIFAG